MDKKNKLRSMGINHTQIALGIVWDYLIDKSPDSIPADLSKHEEKLVHRIKRELDAVAPRRIRQPSLRVNQT